MKEDEAKKVLLEYYKQTTEDCRTVGVQKVYIVISLAIMVSTSLFNILNIKNDGKIFSISNMNSFEVFFILAFIITILITVGTFIFLFFHLPILDKNVREIEELHREILFGKMRDRYLFCWDDIPGSDNHLLKNFLIENFNLKWIKNSNIEKIDNDMTIILSTEAVQQLLSVTNILLIFRFKAPIHLYFLRILNYWTACTRCIFKKSLSLTLNNEKTTVILKVNKITDEFYIKDEEKLKVFEPELKYRFRKIYPHLNVYNQWNSLNKKIGLGLVIVIFSIFLITIILIIFKSILNYI